MFLPPPHAKDAIVTELRRQLSAAETPARGREETPVSTGCEALDRVLPSGGLRRGALVEWLAEGDGSGAATLALLAAREASREGGAIVVFDRRREFYPPAAWGFGIPPRQLIVVQPRSLADERWAFEQCLRSTGVAATWGCLERVDAATFRRWQLAIETSGGLGMLVRPAKARGAPTWSDLQLLVRPRAGSADSSPGRRLRVEVIRCRGGPVGAVVELEIDETTGLLRAALPDRHETHPLPATAELVHCPPARRAARA